jgi:hypothetical protein
MRFGTGLVVISAASLSFAALLAIGACGGSSSTPSPDAGGGGGHDGGGKGDSGGKATPLDDADVSACQAFASAQCAEQAKCNPAAQSAQYGSMTECISRFLIVCETGLQAPATGASATQAKACAAAVETEACTDYLDQNTPTACVYSTGPGANGSSCSHPQECESAFCAIPPNSTCGKCAAQPAPGASCAELSSCGQGLDCYKGLTCAKYVLNVDDPCSATQPCGAGLDCVIASGATSGICRTSGFMVGAACDPRSETGPSCYFELGFYCDSDSKSAFFHTCQMAKPVGAGQPCGDKSGGGCVNSTCIKGSGDAGSTCVAQAADNASCDTVTGPACTPPARCVGPSLDGGTKGTCELPVAACH